MERCIKSLIGHIKYKKHAHANKKVVSHCCNKPGGGVTLMQSTWRRGHAVTIHLVEWSQCCYLPDGGFTLLLFTCQRCHTVAIYLAAVLLGYNYLAPRSHCYESPG